MNMTEVEQTNVRCNNPVPSEGALSLIDFCSAQYARLLRPTMLAYVYCCLLMLLSLAPGLAHAVETVCARIKIEIKQELTLSMTGDVTPSLTFCRWMGF